MDPLDCVGSQDVFTVWNPQHTTAAMRRETQPESLESHELEKTPRGLWRSEVTLSTPGMLIAHLLSTLPTHCSRYETTARLNRIVE